MGKLIVFMSGLGYTQELHMVLHGCED